MTISGTPLTACSTISGEGACTIQCMVGSTCTVLADITGLDADPEYVMLTPGHSLDVMELAGGS